MEEERTATAPPTVEGESPTEGESAKVVELAKEGEVAKENDLILDYKVLTAGLTPTPDNLLYLDGYLDAYIEMNKFLGVLGAIFNMVTNEVKSKVSILREHRQSAEGEHYETVSSLLRYEQSQAHGGVPGDRGGRPSGARTLLRLHRALEFVMEFLGLLLRPKEGFFGGQVSRVYGATLGRHHNSLIKATTSTALFTMSSHATIMQKMMKGKTVMSDSVRLNMEQAIAAIRAAYDYTQSLYQQYGYLDLP
ncbi:ceramide-1-phosphate transfer protein-like isoform X2 [Eriocheir sinensis]|nr:ceramide-1-phosphate transfer protein-like isoform X2 [Eriocheir sinensis]